MKQRGFGYIEIIIGLLVLGIAAGVVYTYNSAIADKVKAEADNATLRQTNSELATDNHQLRERQAQTDVLLAKRQIVRNDNAEMERKLDALLDQVYRNNEAARVWRDQPVPAAVLDSLRREPAGKVDQDRKGTPAAKPGGAKPPG